MPHTAQPCKFSVAEHIISFAEPTEAQLLEQQWQWGVLVEQQNVSAWKSACANVDEPFSHSLEVLRNPVTLWNWPEF